MDELRKLADRFRRLAARPDGSSKSLALACEDGGQLLLRLSEAGRLPFELPAPEQNGTGSDYVGLVWAALWDVGVYAMSPGNPHCIEWKATAESVRIGTTSRETWRDRAERYATFCDSLADELPASTPRLSDAVTRAAEPIPDSGVITYLPNELAKAIGVDTKTLAKYRKRAGLPPLPGGRGKGKYSAQEAILTLRKFVDDTSNSDVKAECVRILEESFSEKPS